MSVFFQGAIENLSLVFKRPIDEILAEDECSLGGNLSMIHKLYYLSICKYFLKKIIRYLRVIANWPATLSYRYSKTRLRFV